MEDGHSITPRQASRLFDCDRLGARIYDLKREGVPVASEWEEKRDADGRLVKRWKKYFIPRQ